MGPGPREGYMKVEMAIDGKIIPLNDFTQEIIGNVAAAMAGSLRGVDNSSQEIVIKVQRG
jgi:hypothetical protein